MFCAIYCNKNENFTLFILNILYDLNNKSLQLALSKIALK